MVKKAAKFIISGTVQGIFFRRFVKEHADDLGLKGFCRNLSDGRVEVIVEGESEQIERLARFIRKGPEHAQIKNLKVEERKWSGDFDRFKILRF